MKPLGLIVVLIMLVRIDHVAVEGVHHELAFCERDPLAVVETSRNAEDLVVDLGEDVVAIPIAAEELSKLGIPNACDRRKDCWDWDVVDIREELR